ncbi:MAG: bifunctional riboflavin kinase/FAD synthetase, partial [Geminicoccaceae bacterium]
DHADLPAAARGASVAIGNFDGVHRGHREVIRVAAEYARSLGRALGVVTFEPHPREVLNPGTAPGRLTPLRRKAELLRDLGVERLYVCRCDRSLLATSAESFVRDRLLGQLDVAAVTTGRDFRFGYRRQGDTELLRSLLAPLGRPATAVDPVGMGGEVCSSTAIRLALAEGQVEQANLLLGYPYQLEGIVRQGDRRGRELGFPTANVHPVDRRPVFPAPGIYLVDAAVWEGGWRWHPAVAYFGSRPTFDGRGLLLEVHLLDGDPNLYGRRLRVAFRRQLRGDRTFASFDELKAQIARDCEQARILHAPIPA